MGLDMYLDKHIYIGADYDFNGITGTIDLKKNDRPIEVELNKVKYIVEEGAYWRKANQVHAWFVENVQDGEDNCGTYYVSHEQLQELVDLCHTIMKAYTEDVNKGVTVAQKLLPTQAGFFFGTTDYDTYYFEDIQDTINQLEPLLEDRQGDYYYHASW